MPESINKAFTANEIEEIPSGFGCQFSGDELKAISKENIPGVKIKKQDTSPSYSFGKVEIRRLFKTLITKGISTKRG